MGLAPTAGGPQLHPGFLAGLGNGNGQGNQQGWQWQRPEVPQFKDPPLLQNHDLEGAPGAQSDAERSEKSGLPAWLVNYNHEDKKSDENRISATWEDLENDNVIRNKAHKLQPAVQPLPDPEAQLNGSTHLDDMRKVIRSIQEHNPLRKTCSRRALRHLLDSGCEFDKVLEFWADPLLNPWAAKNLPFLVAHCVELSKVEEMGRFCAWTARQFYVGICPDRNLKLLFTELSRFREEAEWQAVLTNFCQSILQALQSSPILHVTDLDPEIHSSVLAICFEDIYSVSMLDLGLDLVKSSGSIQLRHLTEVVWPIIEHWVYTWEPSRCAELSSMTLSAKIANLLHMIPRKDLLEVIKNVSSRILHDSFSDGDIRTLSQRHSLWWSAIRSLDIFQYVKRSKLWSEISVAIRSRQETEIEMMALMEIDEHLNQKNLKAAYRAFARHPQVTLEQCPHLAEALILDPNQHWWTSFILREDRQPVMLAKLQTTNDVYTEEKLRHTRIRLLERMALAYGQQEHIPVSMIFRHAYGCWEVLERDGLGPMGPAMAQALTLCGIVRPLQARLQVSRPRMEWILRMVAEVEGTDTSEKLGAAVYEWLNEAYRHSRDRRDRVLQQSLDERHREQNTRVQKTGAWDNLTTWSSAQQNAPSRHEFSLRPASAARAGPDTSSASIVHKKRWNTPQGRTSSITFRAPFEQASHFSPEHDGQKEIVHPAEDASISALELETVAYIRSTKLNPTSPAFDATKVYHAPSESHPPASSFEEPQNVSHPTSRNESWQRHVRDPARRSVFIPNASPLDTSPDTATDKPLSGFQFRYIFNDDTREDAVNRYIQERRVRSLHTRLNAARLAGVEGIHTSTSPLSKLRTSALLCIPSCSLGIAALDPIVRGNAWSKRRRLPGLQARSRAPPVHGMKDYQGPTTLSNTVEPAWGRGLLHVPRILEAVRSGERHLDLRALSSEREESSAEGDGIVDGGAWWDRDD